MLEGRFRHDSIAQARPVAQERLIGYAAHYLTGIVFAFLMLAVTGRQWLADPAPLAPLLTGLVSIAAPFLVMQPAFGFGVAASKMPQPWVARGRSLIAHLSFGVGLYVTAIALHAFTR